MSVDPQPTGIEDVASTLRLFQFRYSSEHDLQEAVAAALRSHGFSVEREVRASPNSRLDLLVDGAVAVETKLTGSAGVVERQVRRYLALPEITGVVLVTSRVSHMRLANARTAVVCLAGAWL